MAITEDAVREALLEVVDPELFVSIIDLGLVYKVEIEPQDDKSNIKIEMTLTSPACPVGPQIMADVNRVLGQLDGAGEVDIKLVMDPPWSPDKMTEDARDKLGIF